MSLVSLFGWLDYFRNKRRAENLSQAELLRRETVQILLAIIVALALMGGLLTLAWLILR